MKKAAVSGRLDEVFDVFADKALAGNPLAIVHDCEGLTDACSAGHRAGVQPFGNGVHPCAGQSRP